MKKRKFILRLASVLLIISLVSSGISFFVYLYSDRELDYSLDERLFELSKKSSSTTYLAYNDRGELFEVFKSKDGGSKSWYSFDSFGENIKNAFLSSEDREFYSHSGINLKRTAYAFVNYLFDRIKGEKRSFGASTITQQVIKNISGDNEYSLKRKLDEILRAKRIEKNHTKNEIFEMYLNIVPMSDNVLGVGAAAEYYFHKHPLSLELSEAAMLAGVTNSPRRFDPYQHPEECIKKRNNVLYAMLDNGAITNEEYLKEKEKPLGVVNRRENKRTVSNWFVETAREDIVEDLSKEYGITRSAARLMLASGTRVILTMDLRIQRIAEEHFIKLGERLGDEAGCEGALVVTDSKSGDLVAIVGALGEKTGERLLNYASVKRTPGSVLKPIALYAPLLDDGLINWSTIVDDSPVRNIKDKEGERPYPRNSPDTYDGDITISEALARSKNTVAIKLLKMLGERRALDILKNGYGFTSIVERDERGGAIVSDLGEAALALGQLTDGISLREITEAYSVFIGDGVKREARSYLSVTDSEEKVILSNKKEEKRILKQSTARIMNKLLEGVVYSGTARSVRLKERIDTAGKTGTSGGDRDRWFVGYTPYYTAGVWLGKTDSSGGVGALGVSHVALWDEIMCEIEDKCPSEGFTEGAEFPTEGLVFREYCKISGKTPSDECIGEDGECSLGFGFFTTDNLPRGICDSHFISNNESGKKISEGEQSPSL